MLEAAIRNDLDLGEYNVIEPDEYTPEGTRVVTPKMTVKYGKQAAQQPVTPIGEVQTIGTPVTEETVPAPPQQEIIPTVQETEELKQTPSGRELLMQLYERHITEGAPKPTFDTTAPEYYKRAAKYNAIGKGLSTLAGALSLSRGGNVVKPEPDQKTPAYIAQHFKYLDDYRDKVDKYDYMNHQNKSRLYEMAINDEQRKEEIAQRWKEYALNNQLRLDDAEAERKWRAEQAALENEYRLRQIKAQNEGDLSEIEMRGKYGYGRSSSGRSGGGTDKTIKIVTSDRKTHEYSPEDASYMRRVALDNAETLSQDFPKLFVQVPVEENGEIVPGKFTIELAKETKDEDVIRALLEYNMKLEAAKAALAEKTKNINMNGYQAWLKDHPEDAKQPKTEKPKPNITKEEYDKLQPGDEYYYNGEKLIKE